MEVIAHIPVMLDESIRLLSPGPSKQILDCTFGRGGHSKALLQFGATVTSLDRDMAAFRVGQALAATSKRFTINWYRFSEMMLCRQKYNGILFDFGISSDQLLDDSIGISFRHDAPLNMSLGRSNKSAYSIINDMSEDVIADVVYKYGEERYARVIAKSIVKRRKQKRFTTTIELADHIRQTIPRGKIDAATRTFQAIRIYVNNELEEIELGLLNAIKLAKPGGIVVAISFHSLEDRIVKHTFRRFKHRSDVILPSRDEIRTNPRSRSAKLRWMRVS